MSDFEKIFFEHYLRYGLGAMPKADVDALVMHILDKYGGGGYSPLGNKSNQTVSETLKTPLSKVKRLRYEAALKFGARAEDEAIARLLAAISQATLDSDGDEIHLIVEDALAKHWLQGKLKESRQIFDTSFNSEIIKVSAAGLFGVLGTVFDESCVADLREAHEKMASIKGHEARVKFFKKALSSFVTSAAREAGKAVPGLVKGLLAG